LSGDNRLDALQRVLGTMPPECDEHLGLQQGRPVLDRLAVRVEDAQARLGLVDVAVLERDERPSQLQKAPRVSRDPGLVPVASLRRVRGGPGLADVSRQRKRPGLEGVTLQP
jgi:hypothetical protein